ncbi:MAG: transposase [Treponema sp.]|nr:transposase [Treponema sp.]
MIFGTTALLGARMAGQRAQGAALGSGSTAGTILTGAQSGDYIAATAPAGAGGGIPQTEIIEAVDYKHLYEGLLDKCAQQGAVIEKLQDEKNGGGGKPPRFSNSAFEFFTNLQYKVKSQKTQLDAFKSGQKYTDMMADFKAQLAEKDKEIKKLKRELEEARRQAAEARKIWEQVADDLEKEKSKELSKKDSEIRALDKKLLEKQNRLDEEKGKYRGKVKELYKVKTELEDEQGKTLKLRAQINRNYENSSKPSSASPNRKKITNNREKTGKKPGGQPGHKGHPRKKHAPTNTIEIPAPEEYGNSQDYKPTGKTITKQLVDIRVEIVVTEYSTPEFRDVRTGQRVHAEFPEGMVNEVNYSGNIKAFSFLLNNRCNVSIAKTSDFLSELTGGELKISTGMINGLSKEFSLKTEAEQKKAFADLLLSPVMNTDFTTVRVNGKNMNVLVCATPDNAMYFAREHKGHEGVKGTPVEDYQNDIAHDHDVTFYNYGNKHQECLGHPSRYLKNSMENEPKLKWNQQMRELIREMIHFRNSLDPEDERDPDKIDPDRVKEFEAKYDEILDLAKEEYEYEPPSKYYKDGFNLYKRMRKYRDNHLLFLHNRRIPTTNNLAERLLRPIKRKQAQMMVFRSFKSLEYLCQSMGTIASISARGGNLYESVSSIFGAPHKKG